MKDDNQQLKAIALACSLTPSPDASSSELLASQILDEMAQHNVESKIVRIVDHDIKPGVQIDMGNGDEWPIIRQQVMEADILLIATPIWVGHASSLAQRVIERLDAELGEMDDEGRLLTYDKVGIAAVVGNEDGAHKASADILQALAVLGFSIPAGGYNYWVGEAMHKVDYKDLDKAPENVASNNKSVATNAVHLARLLKNEGYPPAS